MPSVSTTTTDESCTLDIVVADPTMTTVRDENSNNQENSTSTTDDEYAANVEISLLRPTTNGEETATPEIEEYDSFLKGEGNKSDLATTGLHNRNDDGDHHNHDDDDAVLATDHHVQPLMNPYCARDAADEESASIGSAYCESQELHEERQILPIIVDVTRGMPAHYPGHDGEVKEAKEEDEGGDEEAAKGEEDDEEAAPAEQPNDNNNKGATSSAAGAAEKSHSVIGSGIETLKYLYSTVLLVFCVVLVMVSMFTQPTTTTTTTDDNGGSGSTARLPPIAACILFWFLLVWLAMMEGGQGALVGLQPIDPELYADSHPRALRNTRLAHKGDNMERFIVGRQFLVVLVVFLVNSIAMGGSDRDVLGLGPVAAEVFLSSGAAVILTTIMIGQLLPQINAANCMLDFINNYFMLATTYLSLLMEMSGLLHCVYLVQVSFARLTKTPIASEEPPRTTLGNVLFWGRVVASLTILGFALAVTLQALFLGQTAMWKGVPEAVSVVLFFVLMCIVGLLEGMQIALFAVVNLPPVEYQDIQREHPTAHKTTELTFRKKQNLQAFLIGRQILVTACMFVVARITTLDVPAGAPTIFGVSPGVQAFFNTGLLGAVITTVCGSLAWRVIASSFPVAFLSNPVVYALLRVCLVLEKSGLCSASWVLARYHKPLANYQPDEVHLEGAEPETAEAVTRRDKDIDRLVNVFKMTYSLALLVFAVILVMGTIFTKQTTATAHLRVPPVAAFATFWFLIAWLAMMEGGQGALVGLQPIGKERYRESHPRTYKNTVVAHRGENMERFIVGRQFLVVIVVFVTNMMASTVEGASVLGLPEQVTNVFLSSGVALILVTIMIGQLTAQVNGANCMLDFLNNYFMLFTTYVSLAIEFSGLLHSVYLVQILFSKISGKEIESAESARNAPRQVWFWGRVVMSLAALGISFAVTLEALFNGQTTMWDGVPGAVSVILLFLLMGFVGMMEGMQIALFAVVNLDEEELKTHSIAYANCQLAFDGQNLQAFLIGRQICVTVCMFVVARITTLNVDIEAGDPTIFGVGEGLQNFFNTGLLGAVITTIVASLIWRVVASSFPLAFLSNPLIYVIIRLCLIFDATGICSAAWVLGRWNKLLAGFQPDEVYLEGAEPHGKEPVTRRDKDVVVTITMIKYIYSLALLVFSVVLVMALIFQGATPIARNVNEWLAFFVFWFLLVWLAMMEGGQGCLVGLQPVDKDLYRESHKVSFKCANLAHRGDNMGRFILGRQFLVVLVVFVTNAAGAAVGSPSVFDLPEIVLEIFVSSGLAMILTTIIIGQLTAQINAANCMLDFINTYFMLFTIYVSLFLEMSGLLHSVYLVQIIFSKITGKAIESDEPARTVVQKAFFWIRVLLSLVALGISLAVTLEALFKGQTAMWEGVPEGVSVVIFLVLMCFVGLMEGMQIALFAVVNLPEEELRNYKLAKKTCDLTFQGSNLQAFLIGRQICVTICMFVVARITTLNVDVAAGDRTIFGVGEGLQRFFNTGLLGAVITTIIGSLSWRIIASSFPVAFLSNPLVYLILRLCLLLEATGICSAAWLLALFHKQLAGYQLDEVYVGTTEERAAAVKSAACVNDLAFVEDEDDDGAMKENGVEGDAKPIQQGDEEQGHGEMVSENGAVEA